MKRRILALLISLTIVVTSILNPISVSASDGTSEQKISGWKKFTTGFSNICNSAVDGISGFFSKSDKNEDKTEKAETPGESDFERGYKHFSNLIGSTVSGINASEYITSIQREILIMEDRINTFVSAHNYPTASAAGFVAEEWHAGTYNINATANGSDSSAVVPRSNANGSADIVLSTGEETSLKYYKTANDSARAQVEYKYGDQQRIIPSDQIDDGIECLNRLYDTAKSCGDDAVAQEIETAKSNMRSTVKSSDGTESAPLSKSQSEQIVADAQDGNFHASDYGVTSYSAAKIGLETVKGGATAMLISVPLAVAPDIIDMTMELVKSGAISTDDIKNLGTDARDAAAYSFITGSLTSLITMLCQTGKLGKELVNPSVSTIALLVNLAINSIQQVFKYVNGDITLEEMWDAIAVSAVASLAGFGTTALIGAIISNVPQIIFVAISIGITLLAVKYYDAGKQLVISFANSTATFVVSAYGTCKEALTVAYEKTSAFAKNASEVIATTAVNGFNYAADALSEGWSYATDAVTAGWNYTSAAVISGWNFTKDFCMTKMGILQSSE